MEIQIHTIRIYSQDKGMTFANERKDAGNKKRGKINRTTKSGKHHNF